MAGKYGGTPFIGVVSDTHGYFDEQLDELFAGAARIVHAGDVGAPDVLARLQALAPLTAVAGNTDLGGWGDYLPWEAVAEVAGRRLIVCHIGHSLMGRHDPVLEGFALVISGHTHKAAAEWRGDTLFLNPGSAGRPRFGQPRTCALVGAPVGGKLDPRIVSLV
jgi:putative phosphoesterase